MLVFDAFTLHSLPETSSFIADAEAAVLEADLFVFVHVGEYDATYRKVQSASVRLPTLGVIHTSVAVKLHKMAYTPDRSEEKVEMSMLRRLKTLPICIRSSLSS